MKKIASWAVFLMLVGPVVSETGAAERRRNGVGHKARSVKVVPPTPELVGTITYDTSTNAGFHPDGTNGANQDRVVGNRFNTNLGGPLLNPGMVTMLTVFPANDGSGQYVSLADPPTPANTAMVIDFFGTSLMAGQFNQVTFPPVTVAGDFIGWFMGAFTATQPAGLLGMSDMQNAGQGYHALEAFYIYPLGYATMVQPVVPARNAMLRATGDILVPVELMDFKIK